MIAMAAEVQEEYVRLPEGRPPGAFEECRFFYRSRKLTAIMCYNDYLAVGVYGCYLRWAPYP